MHKLDVEQTKSNTNQEDEKGMQTVNDVTELSPEEEALLGSLTEEDVKDKTEDEKNASKEKEDIDNTDGKKEIEKADGEKELKTDDNAENKETIEKIISDTLNIGIEEKEEKNDIEKIKEENEELKRKVYNVEVSKKISSLMAGASKDEADILIEGIDDILKSSITADIGKDLDPDKRAALLITMARGNRYNELMKVKKDEIEGEKEKKKKYEELINQDTTKKDKAKTETEVLNELRERALEGDEEAEKLFIEKTSPEINEVLKKIT